MKKCLNFLFVFLATTALFAQQKSADDASPKLIQVFPEKISWSDSKPPLPTGAKVAILEGDPKQAGIFTMRIQLPPQYLIPAHKHPKDERVTVLSGSVYVGIGDSIEDKSAAHYTAGCYYVNPPGVHHYVFTGKEGAEIQITGLGPWGLEYIEKKK